MVQEELFGLTPNGNKMDNNSFPIGDYPREGIEDEQILWINTMVAMSTDENSAVSSGRRKIYKLHAVHYKIVHLMDKKDYNSIVSYIKDLTEASDVGEIRTALIIMKRFRDHDTFKQCLFDAVSKIETVTGRKLL
jgi:hypothetical protein